MSRNHWLVKQEPEAYSWNTFLQDGRTAWTGVRNYQARNFLRAMKEGDAVLFYHSVREKRVVGIAKVVRAAYVDPSASDGDWSAVDLVPVKPLVQAVALEAIKEEVTLQDILLVRHSRLSVMPLAPAQYRRILSLGKTTESLPNEG